MDKPYHHHLDFYLVIPCYNNLQGLIQSLQSIRYHNDKFAILVIDDGSSEPVQLTNLLPYVPGVSSIEIIRMPENSGITKALNAGLQWLEKKNNFHFIARLDCGDICSAHRFYRQVSFLQENIYIDLIGSWCVFENFSTGFHYQYRTPTEHKKISKGMHFRNMFIHPTVIWRRDSMQKTASYPEEFPHAEDYGFFYEMLNKGRCAVIPENLVTCEINNTGISLLHRKEQLKSRIKVVRQYGKNKMLSLIGILKLRLLITIPYPVILQTKKIFYG
jgi:glycosyltransferase involved in cell wall biosynthesis